MTMLFPITAGALGIIAGSAHSYLGERKILWRLFAEGNSQALEKGRTRELLRAVWHIPSLAWIVLGLALVHAGLENRPDGVVAAMAGTVFVLSGVANWMALKSIHISGGTLVAAGLLSFASIVVGL
ncbi:MAG: hypothetical protein Q8L94_02790 [Parvibaculum sp.]|uniref:hypothetical protein n=2 Tax=Parvibaculum sp. TaxID=2024848 RepID=UPI0027182446|nr:hypothetical protein [Parvibaculum sp.]MDO9127023.1 hypothetical protein [Parvibaculum sp.]MDP1626032.1 hypothetical protein [Parvibaculum sp.]